MPGVDSYTLEGWFRTTGSGPIYNFNECVRGGCGDSSVGVGVNSDSKLEVYLRSSETGQGNDPYSGQPLVGHRAVADGQWHHFALVRDQVWQRIALYLDGIEEASADATLGSSRRISDDANARAPVILGAAIATGGNNPSVFYNGAIENLVVYHRALSPAEVEARHLAGLSGNCGVTPLPTITCPGIITVQTTDPAGMAVTFATPAPSSPNGSVTVVCTRPPARSSPSEPPRSTAPPLTWRTSPTRAASQ